jgi:hypothetical protein
VSRGSEDQVVDKVIQRCSDCNDAYVRHVNAEELLESPPTQLTVNQAAGIAVSAAAAAAGQPAKASHARIPLPAA